MSHRFHRFTQILDLLNLLGKSHADFADNADFRPVRSWISADFTDDTDSTGVTKRGNRIPSLLFYNQTKTICLIGEIISTIGSLFVVTRSLVQLAVQAKCILIDRPQQLIGMSRRILSNILCTHQSEVVPTLALEEELAASFLQYSLDDISIAAYERVVGIE